MGDGLNISNLPQNVQNYIKEHNIDVDGNGKVNGTELANILAQVSESNVTGDSFSANSDRLNPNAIIPKQVISLLGEVLKIMDARQEDQAQFDTQMKLISEFIRDIDEKREISQEQVDVFLVKLMKNGKSYEEKVGDRYTSLDDAVYNVATAFADPQHPTGLKNDELIRKSEETKQTIKEFVKMQANITENIKLYIAGGEGIDRIAVSCNELMALTKKFSVEMDKAMTELQNYGLNVLKEATANMPERRVPEELKSIAKLANTIAQITEQAKADQEEFKKFINFLTVQSENLLNIKDKNKEEMVTQYKTMTDTLLSKVEQFAGRYDSILNEFGKFDLDNNEKLREKADEVEHDKEHATTDFKENSDQLRRIVAEMTARIGHGESVEYIKNMAEHLLKAVNETALRNDEAMERLQENAIDFIKQAITDIRNNDNNASGINATGSEQKETYYYDMSGRVVPNPKEGQLYIHNGKKVIYGQE